MSGAKVRKRVEVARCQTANARPDDLARRLGQRPTARRRPRRRVAASSRASSYSPARSHGLTAGPAAGGGAVSRRNCSIAAAIAAASSGDAAAWRLDARPRRVRLPLRLTGREGVPSRAAVPEIPVFDHDAVLAAVARSRRSSACATGSCEYASGEWAMPPKVYLDASPNGDFRAMPAKGAGLAILKWVTSFPGNPAAGLPVVMGVICVSRAPRRRAAGALDVRSVTALRTGAVAAVAAQELAREDARTRRDRRLRAARRLGRALPGRGRVRARACASTPTPRPPGALAGELGWEAGSARGRARPATSSPA